ACGTVTLEEFRSDLSAASVMRLVGKAQDVIRKMSDLFVCDHFLERRHITLTALCDNAMDLLVACAILPMVVCQVRRKTDHTLTTCLMAGRAVVGEQCPTGGCDELHQLRILRNIFERCCS